MKFFLTLDRVKNSTFVVYDTETNKYTSIPYCEELDCKEVLNQGRDTFRPFGICKDTTHLYVSSNNKIGKFKLDSFEFDGLVEGMPLWVNTHQILKYKDMLISANASNDSLTIFYGDHYKFFDFNQEKIVDEVKIPIDCEQLDFMHINSVSIIDDYLYVMAHNRARINSIIYKIDLNSWEIKDRFTAGICCHNICEHKGNLYTLSTETNEIFEIQPGIRTITFQLPQMAFGGGFLRGMQIVGDTMYFISSYNFKNPGELESAYLYEFNLVTRKVNVKAMGSIQIVNDMLWLE